MKRLLSLAIGGTAMNRHVAREAAIRGALGEGGVFAGQFFGPEDSWATIPGRSHHTRERVEELLAGLRVHQFVESKKPGVDAEGNPKHWHVFHVVAQRSGAE